jgi:hypothetical protein
MGICMPTLTIKLSVWIEQVTIARPQVPERDKWSEIRKVFPTEVRFLRSWLAMKLDMFVVSNQACVVDKEYCLFVRPI